MKRRLSAEGHDWTLPTVAGKESPSDDQARNPWSALHQKVGAAATRSEGSCPLCSALLKYQRNLPRHLSKYHPEAVHACPVAYCGTTTDDAQEACAHLTQCHPWRLLTCPDCPSLWFGSPSGLDRHLCQVHLSDVDEDAAEDDDGAEYERKVYSDTSLTTSFMWEALGCGNNVSLASSGAFGQCIWGASPW